MIPVRISFPAPDYNGIAATQSWTTVTGSFVSLNGDLSQQGGAAIDPVSRFAVMAGIQRTIGVFSTGDLSAVVFLASGVDTNNRVVTASFAGASGGSSTASDAFATFTAEFHRLNYLYSTSAATSVFTVGTGATGSTRFWQPDTYKDPFAVTISVITATAAAVTIQDTPDNPNTSTAPTVFSHATLVTVTANAQSNYAYPVRFTRAIVTTNSATGAGTTVQYIQAG